MLDRINPLVSPFPQDDFLIDRFKKNKKALFSISPFTHQAIVMGRSSDFNEEVNALNVICDGVPVYRRKGGGCAVYLDPGNLIVSAVFPARGFLNIKPLFDRAVTWLANGLLKCGLHNIYTDGISDLVFENRKIGGTCLYRAKGFAYFSASILVATDIHLMERYLRFPPRTPAYRDNRAHTNFVLSVGSCFNTLTIDSLSRDLNKNLKATELTPS